MKKGPDCKTFAEKQEFSAFLPKIEDPAVISEARAKLGKCVCSPMPCSPEQECLGKPDAMLIFECSGEPEAMNVNKKT